MLTEILALRTAVRATDSEGLWLFMQDIMAVLWQQLEIWSDPESRESLSWWIFNK